MTAEAQPLFAPAPPCRHCGSFDTLSVGCKAGSSFQRRKCRGCGENFRVAAVGWVRWDEKREPIVIRT